MEKEMVIRVATLADLETMVGFNLALAFETEGKHLDEAVVRRGVQLALERSELARYFVVECEGGVVGQTMLTLEWSDWRAAYVWWIQSVYITPELRGHGVFTRLYRYLEQLAKDDDECCGLRLYVEVENERAINTSEKLGMNRAGYLFYESLFEEDAGLS